MSTEKYMERALKAIGPSCRAIGPEMIAAAEAIAALCAELEAETREECAKVVRLEAAAMCLSGKRINLVAAEAIARIEAAIRAGEP